MIDESYEIIDVKEAITAAFNALREFYHDNSFSNLALEEVELSDDEKYWYITLGYDVPNPNRTDSPVELTVGGGSSKKYIRNFKIFKIDAGTGKVKSMRIREI